VKPVERSANNSFVSALEGPAPPGPLQKEVGWGRFPLGFTQGYSQYSPLGNFETQMKSNEGDAQLSGKATAGSSRSTIQFRQNIEE